MFSDGSNYVQSSMFDSLKPKIGCSSTITKSSSPFDVRKNDIRDCSMSDFVNLLKAVLGSMFDVWSLDSVFEFDHQ